ncbi:uncharacterized protein [Watersipora subatra]|uniref:uncharacterized protein n=1 Tax=Watersipora subatra TaxID=2589382 RepID=UPI00355C2E79
MASEDESNRQTNMQSLERSDTDVVSRRESVRLKLMHLNNEVAQAIVEEFEHMDHFFGQTEAHTREQIEQYSATVDANLETIEANYNELDRLTEKKTDLETIKNMFDLCTSKIAVNRQKLTVLLEEMDQPKQDDEEDLQEASATFATHMEKFNQLLSRMREREANTITEATPSAYSWPTVMPTRTNNPEVNVESYNSIGAQDTGLQVVKDLTTSLIASMRATKRQSLAPAVYHGDPITFTEWEMDFDAYVETEGLTNIEPLRHLKRFVSGKAYDAISGHFLTNTLSAYYDARAVLKDRFGNKHSVSRALRKKLSEFSKIGPKNSSLLREYADLLAHIRSAMSDVTQLNILDDSEENEKLVAKLPDFMIRSWVKTVKERRQARKPYPDFKEFTSFVIDHAEIMEEPLMQLTSMNLKDKPKQQRIYPSARVSALATSTGYANSCICCKKPHATAECYTLRDMKAAQQEAFVKQHRLCFGCLGSSDHRSKECPKRATCKKCQKRHPTALHREPHEWERNRSTDTKAPETQTNTSGGMKMETKPNKQYTSTLKESQGNTAREDSLQKTKKLDVKFTSCAEKGLNMILPVYVSSQFDPQKEVLIYAMLDSQSDSTFLTTDVGGMLNTDTTIEDVQMETLNGSTLEKINLHHNILVRGFHECTKLSIAAYAWNDFSCDKDQIPTRDNLAKYEHLVEISKFLPPLLDIPVAMLIGRDCSDAFAPIETIRGQKGQPFAEKTVLGWTAMGSGKRQNGRKTPRVSVNACNTVAKILSDDSDTLSSQDDIKFMEILSTGTVQRNDGYFQMPLPFRSRPKLPNNRLQALGRLASLTNKFKTDPSYKEKYTEFINELIQKGHAEEVHESNKPESGEMWYIPHFSVKHPRKHKLRVVFDCSATYANTSINQHLLQGPDHINSLVGILSRFRQECIALTCDVEKMFYNFYVKPEDRDFLRFLWQDESGNVKDYRMTVHLFGAVSSPAVATYGLRKLAQKNKATHPIASTFIERNFYVDDGVTSVEDASKARKLIEESRELCSLGNLRLHKFLSNKQEALIDLPESECIEIQSLFEGKISTHRTLGLEWAINTDEFTFSSQLQDKASTRRGILSVISQIYDPLGFLSPYVLSGKNILQKANSAETDWDEPVSSEIAKEWQEWKYQLSLLESITIPRCIKPPSFGKVIKTELHHFADASFNGIGACSYIKMTNHKNEISTGLLMAKSRVVPSKGKVTIPRLELQAALLATRLSKTLKHELDLKIDEEHYWSDSQIVLSYIANDSKRFQTYVANRVHEIREHSQVTQWHHIAGEHNPADIASRGIECHKLMKSIWFHGPEFLREKQTYPSANQTDFQARLSQTDPEVRRIKKCDTKMKRPNPVLKLIEHFSTKIRLLRVVGTLQKMVRNKSWKLEPLEAVDLRKAENLVIQVTQQEYLSAELNAISTGNAVSKGSALPQLNPFINKDGLLCVGGRAEKSPLLSYTEKHPIIMPKHSLFARHIVQDVHNKTHHLGRSYTLTAIRQAGFWLVGGTRLVKEMVGKCVTCRTLRGKSSSQQMGDLPLERTGKYPPFMHTGMDCFGPFEVKERRTELKKYGLVFTCLYTRGIHIELLDDLSTNAFLNALRCFISIRGHVKTLYSDNGTNFIGAKNELDKQLKNMVNNEAKQILANMQINFIMSTPTASHQGGVWERQIRTIRSILDDIFYKHKGRFDTSMLRTAFCEVMATANSRPLSLVDVNDPEELPITPNALLTGKPEPTPPPPGEFTTESYAKARWKEVQCLAEAFWQKWKVTYFDEITKRQKWADIKVNLAKGDVVLLVEHDMPRNHWRKAIVEETYPGSDGLVRKVSVRLASKFLSSEGKPMEKRTILHRPVQKLVKLE